MAKILIADDEKNIRDGLRKSLEYDGYEVDVAEDGDVAIKKVYAGGIDLVVSDLRMPKKDGQQILLDILEFDDNIPVIILTGHGNIETAVELMRKGAYDFLTKPLNLDKLSLIIARALENKKTKKDKEVLESRLGYTETFYGMIGRSSKIQKVYNAIKQVGTTKATCLIEGESGTGKELIAGALHKISDRRDKPFIKVNCAALSEGVLESELFGHEKGAFTGAIDRKIGRFEAANKGSIFLDEIGEVSQAIQVKLLRVLQDRVIERVGSSTPIPVDIRVIAATNKRLAESVKNGDFREDLFYRLNVIRIDVPPLRERKEDIPILIDNFIKEFSREHNKDIISVDNKVYKMMSLASWVGNIRQLRNTIETMVIMSANGKITENDIPVGVLDDDSSVFTVREDITLDELQKLYIEYMLAKHESNKARTADILGIERATLYRKIKSNN